jgi:hypothetical protein
VKDGVRSEHHSHHHQEDKRLVGAADVAVDFSYSSKLLLFLDLTVPDVQKRGKLRTTSDSKKRTRKRQSFSLASSLFRQERREGRKGHRTMHKNRKAGKAEETGRGSEEARKRRDVEVVKTSGHFGRLLLHMCNLLLLHCFTHCPPFHPFPLHPS